MMSIQTKNSPSALKHTPLYEAHAELGAKLVDFAGWEMPLHYGSQVDEHHKVRKDAGMFDVSHMRVSEISGKDAQAFLRKLAANDVAKLNTPGRALYTCMLNANGGVIDDLIIYFIDNEKYRIVTNAATWQRDSSWISEQINAFPAVSFTERDDLSIIAVQGPNAREKALPLLPDVARAAAATLKPFFSTMAGDTLIGATGYTGEDGFEIILPAEQAPPFWRALHSAGVAPAGLGARDTLRLEAGMNLYGQDMDEEITPLESGLAWTVAMRDARDFIGRSILAQQKEEGLAYQLLGVLLLDKGVPRPHQIIKGEFGDGVLTSGSFSPTLGCGIGLARVPIAAKIGQACHVEARGRALAGKLVKIPFVRNGQACWKET